MSWHRFTCNLPPALAPVRALPARGLVRFVLELLGSQDSDRVTRFFSPPQENNA